MSKISVCVTTYNHGAYISRCLESILEQEGDFSLEVLVGDDGSIDSTRDLVAAFAEQSGGVVQAVFHEQRLGASENVTTLARMATGDYIAHLDGDDYWLPGKLQKQLQALNACPGSVAAYCNARVLGKDGTFLGSFNDRVPSPFDLDYLVKCGNFLNHSSVLYRSEARESVTAIEGEYIDYRIHIRLAGRGSLVYVDDSLVVYRWMVDGSMTSSGNDPIYEKYFDAMEEAARLGAGRRAINMCVRRFCRSVFYSALLPPAPERVVKFFRRLLGSALLGQTRSSLLGYQLLALLQLPVVGGRHIVGRMTRNKVFFPTRQHRA